MKAKLFLILCLSYLSIDVWAKPSVVEWHVVWSLYREYSLVDGTLEHRTDQYYSVEDTTIGSHSYRKVFFREEGDYTKEVLADYALREDSVRVYVYDYFSQKEYVFFDFSLKKNDILAMDWIEETDTRKNPVFRVLEIGDTAIYGRPEFHYLKVYDTVHRITDMWLSKVGSVSYGIAWRRDLGCSQDTLEAVLCVDGGFIYLNPEYPFCYCYIPKSEPEYVSCTGKLILVPEPCWSPIARDCYCTVMAIQWGDLTPILSFNSQWASDGDPLQAQGVEYRVGDSVEVEGYVFLRRDLKGELYSELILKGSSFPVSVEKQQKVKLKLFPNPANETITISVAGCKLQRVEILDVNGRVLYASVLNDTDSFLYNVSWLPSGIYLARVKTPCGVLTEKFSVK